MAAAVIGEARVDKGLKPSALSLVSNIVIGVASVAPAYSLAATLGAIAAVVGLITPLVVVIAFIPMLFVSIGYSELNKADPDCGTTFTWATRAFGPRTGWMGGWGIIASDILVMASLAQVASTYTFSLFNATSIATDANSGWVLGLGLVFLAVMTWVCYRGHRDLRPDSAGDALHRGGDADGLRPGRPDPGADRQRAGRPCQPEPHLV